MREIRLLGARSVSMQSMDCWSSIEKHIAMKHIRLLLTLFIVCFIALPSAFSQDISTQGTEFWVSFMGNGYKTNDGNWVLTQVLVSGKRDCSGIIENPNTGWSQDFTVRANNITTISNLESQSYMETSEVEQIVGKGLRIVADDTISVFCTNIANLSFDASYVLPIQALADDYIIQSYDQSTYTGWSTEFEQYLTSAFLIVATEDETIINIIPTANSVTGQHPAGEEFSITLDAGEVYQFRSTYYGNARDLSGTRVTSSDCKKIAVFNGNTLTAIPNSRSSRDLVFEQAMPLQAWGKNFVVTGSYGRNDDYVKITSSANDNVIRKNGEILTTLGIGESYIFVLNSTESSCFLESTYPAAVFLYNTSYDNNDQSGDPSMVWIAPIEQRIDEITFTTFNADNATLDNHYVNIVVETEDINSVYLDGELLSPLVFSRVEGNSEYSYVRKEIEHDVHHLSCANGFNAHVYGFGHAKGYAYLVGSKADNLVATLVINDQSVQLDDTYTYCTEEPVTFFAEINYPNYQVTWDFGDGQTSHQNPATHTYHDKRIYHPTLVVNADAGGCISSASDTLAFYIDVTQKYAESQYDAVCIGSYYSGHGVENVLITNDTILGVLQDNPTNPVCSDSLLVYITAWPTTYEPIIDSRCWTGGAAIYNSHGFSFEYDHAGIYNETLELQSVHGCDSIIMLTLTVAEQITHEFSEHCCEPVYIWDDRPYDHDGDYTWQYIAPSGCDSIVTLHLTMGLPQHVEFDTITCNSFIWNGQIYTESGDYTQHFETYNGCDSTVVCHLIKDNAIDTPPLQVSTCDLYPWNDTTYTTSGYYTDTLTTALGCDSIIHLYLDLSYTPAPEIRCTNNNAIINGDTIAVVTNTEFFSFQYEFFVEDTLGHINNWDSCVWHITKPSWMIEPFSKEDEPDRQYCRVYVAERSDSLVLLSAKVFNYCDTLTTVFYLKSSFLDLDEQSNVRPEFSIVPNPNNGQMELHLDHLTGKVNIKIYDMKGSLIDQIETINDLGINILQYNLKHPSAGIYFFVATSKEGTIAKKVIIE